MTSSQRRRVVVTGLGAVTPLGLNVKDTWSAALAGRSGVNRITNIPLEGCSVQIGAQVKGFDPHAPVGPFRLPDGKEVVQAVSKKDTRKMGRFIQLSLAATCEAYGDAGLDGLRGSVPSERIGVNIGVGMGGLGEIEETHAELVEKGFRRVTPFFVPQVITNLASGQVSILFQLKGPNMCSVSACASSAHAIGESFRLIRDGYADIMVAGGAEAVISPLGLGGFASMRAVSLRNEEPEKASRPFDANRDGFVMGEGAVTLILEDYEFAKKRGAKIYGEVLGYGLSADGYHMTSPAPEAEGAYRAMKMAVDQSGVPVEKIGYVNAHATSTPAGDADEAKAIAKVLGKAAADVHVSSTKSMTGHLLGGAGAIEAMFCLLAMRDGKIPPTINLDELDPRCAETGMNFTPHHSVSKSIDYALSNSFGFGGTNASLLLGKGPQ